MTERLKIAIQSKGRLADGSVDLLRKCGLKVSQRNGELLCRLKELPIDLLLVRDDDIPTLVADNVCELGIVGENVLQETALGETGRDNLETVLPLGFSRCSLKLAVPQADAPVSDDNLNGKRIATTYPRLLKTWLAERDILAEIVVMKGAVEIAPSLGLADAICDLVSSGATLAANGLVPTTTVLDSEAVLIRNGSELSADQQSCFDRLCLRMQGVIRSRDTKYIMLNAPRSELDTITKLLPGSDAPTIMPLAGTEDDVAVHAVCSEAIFWDTLEQLKAAGARSILVLPIEKMMA